MHDVNKILCIATLLVVVAPGLALAKSTRPPITADYNSSASIQFEQNQAWTRNWTLAQHQPDQRGNKNKDFRGKRWEDLTPQQRKKIQKRHQRYDALPRAEKERIKRARQHFRELPPERRQQLRKQWEKMSPEERRKKWEKRKGK